jgi:hypothetical protein
MSGTFLIVMIVIVLFLVAVMTAAFTDDKTKGI